MEHNGDMATQIGEIVPDHHYEETTEWVIHVEQRFQNGSYKTRLSSRDVCIFKMPRSIRDIKRKTYDFDVLPLSPFFYSQDKKELPSAVEDHKLSAVEKTLRRLNVTGIGNLINIVMGHDKEIRDCYEDRAVQCSEKMLAWIMTMGACFIIQFVTYSEEDFNLLFEMHKVYEIVNDILKIENQIPLLVLKLILELDTNKNTVSTFALSLLRFGVFRGNPFSINSESEPNREIQIKQYIIDGHASHLLDLHRMLIKDFLLGSPSGSADNNKNDNHHRYSVEEILLPTAEKLTRAGIKFEQSADGKIRFETNSWESATLFLPGIDVYDSTETRLKNLIALEQCRLCVREGDTRIITYYISLLDRLIDSKEDVAVLRKANIIHNFVGSDEEVADMFNGVCYRMTEVHYSPYDEVKKRVRKHHDKKLHRLIA